MTRKIILDTDPGVDDVVAMALAFMTPPNDTEIALITPVFGNTSLFHTVRNTVTTLNIIDQEREWREKNGYRQPRSDTPLVAMGAEGPIDGSKIIDARFFHGKDGIAEVHSSHPHFTPKNHAWSEVMQDPPRHFIPSPNPAHIEILNMLKQEPVDTVSIVAVGPLTNVATAAVEDPETFSRGAYLLPEKGYAENVVRELVIMGGTLILPGNVTPTGGGAPPDPKLKIKEFNISTDPEAASILFSLTSIHSKTHPDAPRLPRPLKLTLLPLDATQLHGLTETLYQKASSAAVKAGSPLATFLHAILDRTYRKVQSLVSKGRESTVVELHMHDPLALYYAMLDDEARKEWVVEHNVDVRVECTGTWIRGMTLLDQRVRGQRPFEKTKEAACSDEVGGGEDTTSGDYENVDDDEGEWRGGAGNKLDVVWGSSSLEGGNLRTVEILADMIWSF